MKRYFFALMVALLCNVHLVKAQDYSKIAMLGSPTVADMQDASSTVDDDELAAFQWFTGKGGTYISAADIANGTKSLDGYKAVWVVLDRVLNETTAEAFANNLRIAGDPLFKSEVINALTAFYKDGGNLLLTNHAGVLVKELGRYYKYPHSLGAFNSAEANPNPDTWYARVSYNRDAAAKDLSSDPLYAGLAIESFDGFKRFAYTNANPKEDHNCFFTLDLLEGNQNETDQKWADVREQFGAEMLAVWPHIGDYCSAAIVRWVPTNDYKGVAITVGFGGFEYNGVNNDYKDAIWTLTENAIAELLDNRTYDPTEPEAPAEGTMLAHYDMNKTGNCITETVSGNKYEVRGSFSESMPGAVNGGTALRTDAFSTHVEGAALPKDIGKKMTFDLWCAAETYPMGSYDSEAEGWGTIAGNGSISLDISSRGRLKFACNLGTVMTGENYFPKYQWNHIVVAVDGEDGTITMYNNGEQVASQSCGKGSIKAGNGTMLIGKSKNSVVMLSGCLDTFNGLIDDITVYTGIGNVAELNAQKAENEANVLVDPSVRFAGNIRRPQFHAGASANWGNETHGLLYWNGKYHAFYQKNANGQYLSHMHWGHLTSDDLVTWREERTAVAPSIDIDWKGCWSGCVYQDNDFNDGKPTIFYTGVNNALPHIIQANCDDENLIEWKKQTGIFAGGEPDRAMTNDYRDCFVFKSGDKFYMMIGTSKDGRGAASLHVYENGKWTKSEGDYVFAPNEDVSSVGTFWEMPVLTKIGDKWLFCVSTIGAADVRALYWIGTLTGSGKGLRFVPDNNATARTVELDGFAKQGFGLLSPSVMQKDGKTIIIGIVPDKLNDVQNTENGWSHTYSLPREWSIVNGELLQKPYDGLKKMRSGETYSLANKTVNGREELGNIRGRALEIEAEFTVGNAEFGLSFLDNASLSYNPADGMLKVNLTAVPRMHNDDGAFGGIYQSRLPIAPKTGETLKMQLFLDHSILDIFINDRYATSVRVFPTDVNADGVSLFSNGETIVNKLNAWVLDENPTTGIGSAVYQHNNSSAVYDITGRKIEKPTRGFYITNGKKYLVK